MKNFGAFMDKVMPIVGVAIGVIIIGVFLALLVFCFIRAIKTHGVRRGIIEGLFAVLTFPPVLFGVLFAIGMGLKAIAPNWFDEHDKLAGFILFVVYAVLQSLLVIRSQNDKHKF